MEVVKFLIFLAFTGLIIFSSLVVVFSPRVIYSILGAVVCFLSVSGLYFQLNYDFVGVSQIVIYGVGLSILFVFALMLTSQDKEKNLWVAIKPRFFVGFITSFVLFFMIVFCLLGGGQNIDNKGVFELKKYSQEQLQVLKKEGVTKSIGEKLLTKYVLPFEILSLLLLAGILGVCVLAGKDNNQKEDFS